MVGWHPMYWDQNHQDGNRTPDAGAVDTKGEGPTWALLGQQKNTFPTGGYQEHLAVWQSPMRGPWGEEKCAQDRVCR